MDQGYFTYKMCAPLCYGETSSGPVCMLMQELVMAGDLSYCSYCADVSLLCRCCRSDISFSCKVSITMRGEFLHWGHQNHLKVVILTGNQFFCFSKVIIGGLSPIACNFILNYSPSPTGWLVHKQFGQSSIPVGMSPPAANSAASASSASLCFHAKLPAKLAFVPYPCASRSERHS